MAEAKRLRLSRVISRCQVEQAADQERIPDTNGGFDFTIIIDECNAQVFEQKEIVEEKPAVHLCSASIEEFLTHSHLRVRAIAPVSLPRVSPRALSNTELSRALVFHIYRYRLCQH